MHHSLNSSRVTLKLRPRGDGDGLVQAHGRPALRTSKVTFLCIRHTGAARHFTEGDGFVQLFAEARAATPIAPRLPLHKDVTLGAAVLEMGPTPSPCTKTSPLPDLGDGSDDATRSWRL